MHEALIADLLSEAECQGPCLELLLKNAAAALASAPAAEPVAWEYQNQYGKKFLSDTDPGKWHPHDQEGFRGFRALVYADSAFHPQAQRAVTEQEAGVFDAALRRSGKLVSGVSGPAYQEGLRAGRHLRLNFALRLTELAAANPEGIPPQEVDALVSEFMKCEPPGPVGMLCDPSPVAWRVSEGGMWYYYADRDDAVAERGRYEAYERKQPDGDHTHQEPEPVYARPVPPPEQEGKP